MLVVENLVKRYRTRDGDVHAVDGISFTIPQGQTLGLVGESGCGKSTTAKVIVRLEEASSGRVLLDGEDLTQARGRRLRDLRRRVQMVFQDPYASLNPRLSVGQTLNEVLRVHGIGGDATARRTRVADLLAQVGLSPSIIGRFPHELSGGQRQRIGIARALAVEPELLVLDEPVSALDVSVRAEVMNLLVSLRESLNLTYLFISHDLGMVRHISDQIAVMYLGEIVEHGSWHAVSDAPLHPYTHSLQDAVPGADPDVEAKRDVAVLSGEIADATAPPPGCRFHTRCPHAQDLCRENPPALRAVAIGHRAACHFSEQLYLAPTSR